MQQDNCLPFDLPAVARKKVCIAFDGGMLSSDAGVLLLRGVEQQLGIAARLATCLTDRRDPNRIDHTLVEMLRLRMFAIAAGYEDSNDCTTLRHYPVFKMALGRPRRAASCCARSQRCRGWRIAEPDRDCADDGRDGGLVLRQLEAGTSLDVLDIDDTFDAVNEQQLSLFNALFYFDVREGGQLVSDEDGQQLSSLDVAAQEAAEAAAAIARDVLPSRRGGEVVVEVRKRRSRTSSDSERRDVRHDDQDRIGALTRR